MKTAKNCENCGSDNDPLLTNCVYCKTPLPDIGFDTISNEELVLNAGEWIGKVGQDYHELTENFNAWTGKGQILISSNQIEGLAQKYLSLLQVRSLNNHNLIVIYSDLKKEFDNKRKGFLYRLGGGSKKKGSGFLVLIVILSVFVIGFIVNFLLIVL